MTFNGPSTVRKQRKGNKESQPFLLSCPKQNNSSSRIVATKEPTHQRCHSPPSPPRGRPAQISHPEYATVGQPGLGRHHTKSRDLFGQSWRGKANAKSRAHTSSQSNVLRITCLRWTPCTATEVTAAVQSVSSAGLVVPTDNGTRDAVKILLAHARDLASTVLHLLHNLPRVNRRPKKKKIEFFRAQSDKIS